jgi:hypothetical protein
MRSIKIVVPAKTSREHLNDYATKVVHDHLKLPHCRVVEVSLCSSSKHEQDDELTYRVTYVSELN